MHEKRLTGIQKKIKLVSFSFIFITKPFHEKIVCFFTIIGFIVNVHAQGNVIKAYKNLSNGADA